MQATAQKSKTTAWSIAKNFAGGVFEAGKSAVIGVVNIIGHPIRTSINVTYAATHHDEMQYAQTLQYATIFQNEVIN